MGSLMKGWEIAKAKRQVYLKLLALGMTKKEARSLVYDGRRAVDLARVIRRPVPFGTQAARDETTDKRGS